MITFLAYLGISIVVIVGLLISILTIMLLLAAMQEMSKDLFGIDLWSLFKRKE